MSEVFALEKQLADSKVALERREAALKLYKNPEFKRLILDEFCGTECARYAQSSADPALDDRARADSLAIAQSAGHLRRYLSVIVSMGNQAERLIPDIETAIEEARLEGGE